ncbi:pitrilysin family protein [Weissella koreensis]|uniref:EF-P 5-aminopentanol modification-associated protein YfmH n=1 Tax=Weissella koreensis TaxID=165096 RepID=UPI0022BA615C|nr:pitrilysin family protein [Weissella koreensis]MCZ9311364.1 pitrilysin family protein [Weissella koreensis]
MNRQIPKGQHYKLENGLRVHLIQRPKFHQIVSLLTVDYGARDLYINQIDEKLNVGTPKLGIAHFLEHQLFKQPGYDAMVKINQAGDTVNAYTSPTRTSYFTVSLAERYQSLEELLTFTQEPYFDQTAVTREANIISQEIDMYQDDPASQLYQSILGQLYPNDPLSFDIAGTVESVHEITPSDLESAYAVAYRPDQMDLVVVGAFDFLTVQNLIENSPAGKRPSAQRISKPSEQMLSNVTQVKEDTLYLEADIHRNRIAVGQRIILPQATGRAGLKNGVALDLALDLVFSENSPNYRTWYDMGLIDDNFSVELTWERNLSYLVLLGETPEPEELIAVLKQELQSLPERLAELSIEFEQIKRGAIGRLINKFNSLEEWATQFEGTTFDAAFLPDELDLLQSLTFEEMQTITQQTKTSEIASVIIQPE